MNAIENCENIDYFELLEDLQVDITTQTLVSDSKVYVIRSNYLVKIEGTGKIVSPVIDYFYETPELETSLRVMTILDLKKMLYSINDLLENTGDSGLKSAILETSKVLIDSLSDYTKNKSNRNNENVKVIFTKEKPDFPSCPLQFFFMDDYCKDELEIIPALDLLNELIECDKGAAE